MNRTITVVLKTGQEFDATIAPERLFTTQSLSDKAVHLFQLSTGRTLFVQGDNIAYILAEKEG